MDIHTRYKNTINLCESLGYDHLQEHLEQMLFVSPCDKEKQELINEVFTEITKLKG